MANVILLFTICFGLLAAGYLFVNASAASIANSLRLIGPLLLVIIGLTFVYVGRAGAGLPLLIIGGLMLARNRSVLTGRSPGQKSTVRSAWLEMQLDHETGDLGGLVLTGAHEGGNLSNMDKDTLLDLYADLSGDNESAALMEAYLDRRIPGWRETTHTNGDRDAGQSPSSGPMTKEEAYQVLGLSPGAGSKEIVSAHRRLMKAVHPDSGGSTFLAARINEAKDTLLS